MPFTIVHVLSSFGLGGQERVALDLATEQCAAGYDVVAVSLAKDGGPVAAQLRLAGARVIEVAKGDGFDLALMPRLALLFRRERARIVHTHNPQPLIYAAAPAKAVRARVVHTKHGENPSTGRRLQLRKAAATFVDVFVAVSEATAAAARATDESRGRPVRVIANGIDVGRFSVGDLARRSIRRELGIAEGAWVGCVVGRLCPEKQHEVAIRAVAALTHMGAHLVIVGDGPLRRHLAA
ncbi:MAG TPA: glycosyltransferase, partial [Kofleriaceae bacterium]|nr:glycosyltransferase [Kofleriaceae bacterium]